MAKILRDENGNFVGYDRSNEKPKAKKILNTVPSGSSRNSRARNQRSFRQVADLALDGSGYWFGDEDGTTVFYHQAGDAYHGFPHEVRISVRDVIGGLKIWAIFVPDLGVTFSIPYWDSEGTMYGLTRTLDR